MIRVLDKFEDADALLWDELIAASENGSVFQTHLFYRFSLSSAGHDPFVFIGVKNGRYEMLLEGNIQYESNPLTKLFSRRAIVNGGIVTRRDINHADLAGFLERVKECLKDRAIYLEIRNLNDYSGLTSTFLKAGFRYIPHLNFQVRVASREVAFSRLNQSRRRQIRKSLEAGAEIINCPTTGEVAEFYTILHETYKRKVRKPLPGFEFFLRFLNAGLGVFLLVRYHSKIIGGIMCPVYNESVIYEWYIAGEDDKYPGIYPSVLSTWAAIDYAGANNIKTFDFMGAGSPDEHYGVREFKSKFGGESVEFGRYLLVFNKTVYNAGKLFFLKARRGK